MITCGYHILKLKRHHTEDWCTFCDEFSGKETSNFRSLFSVNEFPSRIIHRTEHFVVIPGLGSLGLVYLLILPIEPYSSIGVLPSGWLPELQRLKIIIREILVHRYTAPIMFEHGPATNPIKSGCCIEHAHLHIVATDVELLDDLKQYNSQGMFGTFSDYEPQRNVDWDFLSSWLYKGISYLWYETRNEEQWAFPLTRSIESQFFRKLLASRQGLPEPEWDWVLFPRKEQVMKTYHEFKKIMR